MHAQRIQRGTRVRFIVGPLGATDPANGSYHPEVVVRTGDEGSYHGEGHYGYGGDWHIVRVERNGEPYNVPVHGGQFEVVDA